jgi:hypothetical protein
MKYFRPELITKLNSSNDSVVAEAAEQWERAVSEYQRRLKSIRDKLPKDLKRFVQRVCLHDAVVMPFSRGRGSVIPFDAFTSKRRRESNSTLALCLRAEESLVLLFYSAVSKGPLIRRAMPSNGFDDETLIWLYDEVDVESDGRFTHDILFNNGFTAKLTFGRFAYREVDVTRFIADSHLEEFHSAK